MFKHNIISKFKQYHYSISRFKVYQIYSVYVSPSSSTEFSVAAVTNSHPFSHKAFNSPSNSSIQLLQLFGEYFIVQYSYFFIHIHTQNHFLIFVIFTIFFPFSITFGPYLITTLPAAVTTNVPKTFANLATFNGSINLII